MYPYPTFPQRTLISSRNNRPQAWTGARASPTYSPANPPARLPNGPQSSNQGAFPPLTSANGSRPQDVQQDRIIQALAGLPVRSTPYTSC